MDTTPKLSKFLKRPQNFSSDTTNESPSCTTPVSNTRMFGEMENDDSPLQIACTQEGCDVDVVWDWNSPQAKQRPKKSKKRLLLPQSPKIPVKRYPSNNQIQNFEKLREELQALREAIAVPDNEDSLLLSPVEEHDYKYTNEDHNRNDVPPLTQEIYMAENDEDPFDDSIDEQLILCTQRIEADLANKGQSKNGCSKNLVNKLDDKTTTHFNKDVTSKGSSFNNSATVDSFLDVLKNVEIEHLEDNKLNNSEYVQNQKKRFTFVRTSSENQGNKSNQAGKVEFHRTQSFESTMEYRKEIIPHHKLDEIQRKRKEALAKLESKKKQEHSESPIKCSPEEIEQKRLQALAKLEAKRQQEFIERKRQEALKRLELSRKKNATGVKSSLTKRL